MLEILESLVNLILVFISIFINLIQALIKCVLFVGESISSLIVYTAYMPEFLLSLVVLGLIILFIKFGLNIHKGGANNG